MRRAFLDDPAPESCERYKRLAWVMIDDQRKPAIKAWLGKARKPFAYYSFATAESRQRWLEASIAGQDQAEAYREKQKADRSESLAKMMETIQVGTLLHYSWGYDQTNCEFYQVVKKSGRKVTLRRIGCEIVEGSEGFMCDRRRAVRDRFIEGKEDVVKLIGPWGLSFEYGSCSPTTEKEEHYCSWYA